MMRIYSIRERPEYIPAMLESLENHWPACMPWIQKHMEQVRQTDAPFPTPTLRWRRARWWEDTLWP